MCIFFYYNLTFGPIFCLVMLALPGPTRMINDIFLMNDLTHMLEDCQSSYRKITSTLGPM